jgi:hypothetical protein
MQVFGQSSRATASLYAGWRRTRGLGGPALQIAGEQSARVGGRGARPRLEPVQGGPDGVRQAGDPVGDQPAPGAEPGDGHPRRAMLDDLALSDRQDRTDATVRSKAADEQLLAESALLNADPPGPRAGTPRPSAWRPSRRPRPARGPTTRVSGFGRPPTREGSPIEPLLADAAPASDLLDVFNSYDGSVLFRGLTEGVGRPALRPRDDRLDLHADSGPVRALGICAQVPALGRGGKMEEIAKTWIVIAFMMGGPLLMRAAMQGADSVYASSVGGPPEPDRRLRQGRVRDARADPALRRPEAQERSPQGGQQQDNPGQQRAGPDRQRQRRQRARLPRGVRRRRLGHRRPATPRAPARPGTGWSGWRPWRPASARRCSSAC